MLKLSKKIGRLTKQVLLKGDAKTVKKKKVRKAGAKNEKNSEEENPQ
jgi:hypothetical protein